MCLHWPISSKKQQIVSKSFVVAEYRAMSYTTSEVFLLARMLSDLQVPSPAIQKKLLGHHAPIF